jgi:hypothetical protein
VERDSEDDAWRSIVEHYGERVSIDADDGLRAEPVAETSASASPWDEPGADDRTDPGPDPESEDVLRAEDEDRFVPPPPPPLPRVAPDRLLAWAGVFGTPVVLLTAVVTGIDLPAWLGYLLVGGFIGGFVYLVTRMPRGPRDPSDDGARL